ncbi:hypothetical protein ACVBE9_03950 [Eionea flava]
MVFNDQFLLSLLCQLVAMSSMTLIAQIKTFYRQSVFVLLLADSVPYTLSGEITERL